MPPTDKHPPPLPHDPIEELFEGVYCVKGSMRMGPGMTVDRNMIVLRQGSELMVIDPVRLTPEGETSMAALGHVRHVLRLGDFHGHDDRYYVERFGAEFWCQAGSNRYPEPRPSRLLTADTELPIAEAELFVFRETRFPECAVLQRRHGLLITCDSVQHWQGRRYCSLLTRIVMPLAGFRLGTNIGPLWRRMMTHKGSSLAPDFQRLLELEFEHLIGAHGALCRGDAHRRLSQAVAATFPAGR